MGSVIAVTAGTSAVIVRILALLHVTTSSGELAEEELLGDVCANSFRDADREVSEHQPSTTIGSGIVKVCEAGRC